MIADYMGSRVTRFTPDGEFLGDIGEGKGEASGKVTKPRVVTTGPHAGQRPVSLDDRSPGDALFQEQFSKIAQIHVRGYGDHIPIHDVSCQIFHGTSSGENAGCPLR